MKTVSTAPQLPRVGLGPRPGRLMAVEPEEAPQRASGALEGASTPEGAAGACAAGGAPAARPRRAQPWQLARACALLAGGVALIPTPAPGVLLILWGLKGLGRGFHWARRIEVPIRRRMRRTRVGRLATGIG